MNRHIRTIVVIVACLIAVGCAGRITVRATPLTLGSRTITVLAEPAPVQIAELPIHHLTLSDLIILPTEPASPSCDVRSVIDSVDPDFSSLALTVGKTENKFYEVRNGQKTKLSEPDRQQIGLRVLDKEACRTDVVTLTMTVSKKGEVAWLSPDGWDIQPIMRGNGIRWNKWATDWQVIKPAGRIVIGTRFPIATDVKVKGKKVQQIDYYTYIPYNPDHLAVREGQQYNVDLVARAFLELREAGVKSRAFPDKLVADVRQLKPEYFAILPATEWIDYGEFLADQDWATDYFWTRVGNNGETFAKYSCNRAGACGYMQFTDRRGNGTYTMVRKKYPAAGLIKDFVSGAKDHVNAMKAAILLYDINLASAMSKYGDQIADDPRLDEILAAYYNASPKSVDKSLQPALKIGKLEWTDKLLRETKEYIAKLRYLRDAWSAQAVQAIRAPNQ